MNARRGVALIEVILALGIFSIAVVGLARSLNAAIDADRLQSLNEDIRSRLQNHLAAALAETWETGEKELPGDGLNVQFRRTIRPVAYTAPSGQVLDHIYEIQVTAAYMRNGQEMKASAEVYVYRP